MGVIEQQPTLNLQPDYDLMTRNDGVLPAMGFPNPEAAGVPALEQIQAAISPELENFLLDRAQNGGNHRLVIAPRVGGQQGIGLRGLILSSDSKAYEDDFVWREVWEDVDGRADIHDNSLPRNAEWDTAILLGDTTDPLDPSRSINDFNEPGLAYTYKTVPEQRQLLEQEVGQARGVKVDLLSAPIGHIVTDGVAQRIDNQLQRRGVARLPHYENVVTAGGGVRLPGVDAGVSRLYFGGSYVGGGWYDEGVRRVARVSVPLEA